MKKIYILLLASAIVACSGSTDEEANRPSEWIGEWKAIWETPSEKYPEIEDMEFNMTGSFVFTEDSLTVISNGYPGCIFAVDTLKHTQSWRVSNDTLFLFSDPQVPGMTYKITRLSSERIEMQPVEDIYVTLSR